MSKKIAGYTLNDVMAQPYCLQRLLAVARFCEPEWKLCPICEALQVIEPDLQAVEIELGNQKDFIPCWRCKGLGWI